MGPGFAAGLAQGLITALAIIIILAFTIGVGVTACTMKVGHPTIGWSK